MYVSTVWLKVIVRLVMAIFLAYLVGSYCQSTLKGVLIYWMAFFLVLKVFFFDLKFR